MYWTDICTITFLSWIRQPDNSDSSRSVPRRLETEEPRKKYLIGRPSYCQDIFLSLKLPVFIYPVIKFSCSVYQETSANAKRWEVKIIITVTHSNYEHWHWFTFSLHAWSDYFEHWSRPVIFCRGKTDKQNGELIQTVITTYFSVFCKKLASCLVNKFEIKCAGTIC